MPNSRSVKTGQKRTKYVCHLAFYDFSAVQGKWLGRLVKICGGFRSSITHVGPIIETHTMGDVCITVCEGQTRNGYRESNAKIHSSQTLDKLGVVIVDKIPMGEIEFDLEFVISEAKLYMDSSVWDLVFHAFIGRFLGLTRPRTCTSFACRFFGLPDTWHPATLWRLYR
jgi:hypothetical protein